MISHHVDWAEKSDRAYHLAPYVLPIPCRGTGVDRIFGIGRHRRTVTQLAYRRAASEPACGYH